LVLAAHEAQVASPMSPQKVVSKMIWWSFMLSSMVPPPFFRGTKLAMGMPHESLGLGLLDTALAGSLPYGQYQILMKSEVHCMAQTPPV
jgi:hypothetical protein